MRAGWCLGQMGECAPAMNGWCGTASRADERCAPPESVEQPRMEIWLPASTEAIAATTPVSFRSATREIGTISSCEGGGTVSTNGWLQQRVIRIPTARAAPHLVYARETRRACVAVLDPPWRHACARGAHVRSDVAKQGCATIQPSRMQSPTPCVRPARLLGSRARCRGSTSG